MTDKCSDEWFAMKRSQEEKSDENEVRKNTTESIKSNLMKRESFAFSFFATNRHHKNLIFLQFWRRWLFHTVSIFDIVRFNEIAF